MLELKTYFAHLEMREFRKRHKVVEPHVVHGPVTLYFD